ncbi:MAG: hypothetical protein ACOCRK_10240, partial [bacterium]
VTPRRNFKFKITFKGVGEKKHPNGNYKEPGYQSDDLYEYFLNKETIHKAINEGEPDYYNTDGLYEIMHLGNIKGTIRSEDIEEAKNISLGSSEYTHPILNNDGYDLTGLGFGHSYGGDEECYTEYDDYDKDSGLITHPTVVYPRKDNDNETAVTFTETFQKDIKQTISIYITTRDPKFHDESCFYEFTLEPIPV